MFLVRLAGINRWCARQAARIPCWWELISSNSAVQGSLSLSGPTRYGFPHAMRTSCDTHVYYIIKCTSMSAAADEPCLVLSSWTILVVCEWKYLNIKTHLSWHDYSCEVIMERSYLFWEPAFLGFEVTEFSLQTGHLGLPRLQLYFQIRSLWL